MRTAYGNILLIFFLFFFFGCEFKNPNNGKTTLESKKISDSVVKDIPEYFQREQWKNYFAKLQSMLEIQPIENGFIDWQIRLWIGHAQSDSSQLIIFKKEGDNTHGTLYTYFEPYNSSFDTTTTIFKRLTSLTPNSGWKDFIKRIEILGIFDLLDYKKHPGYYLANDSYGVTVEIATKNKYRIYDYPDYERYVDEIQEAKKMFQIMSLIEKEFKIRVMY